MFHGCQIAPPEQYRTKRRLWSWIKANIRLEIEIQIVVGREDFPRRIQLLDTIRASINTSLHSVYENRTDILIGELYVNGYLATAVTRGALDSPAMAVTPPETIAAVSRLVSIDVRGPGSSSRTIERYREWRRRIIRGLAEEFGAGFVDQVGEGEPAGLPGENLANVPMTPDEEESGREMLAGLMSYKIDEEPW